MKNAALNYCLINSKTGFMEDHGLNLKRTALAVLDGSGHDYDIIKSSERGLQTMRLYGSRYPKTSNYYNPASGLQLWVKAEGKVGESDFWRLIIGWDGLADSAFTACRVDHRVRDLLDFIAVGDVKGRATWRNEICELMRNYSFANVRLLGEKEGA